MSIQYLVLGFEPWSLVQGSPKNKKVSLYFTIYEQEFFQVND